MFFEQRGQCGRRDQWARVHVTERLGREPGPVPRDALKNLQFLSNGKLLEGDEQGLDYMGARWRRDDQLGSSHRNSERIRTCREWWTASEMVGFWAQIDGGAGRICS